MPASRRSARHILITEFFAGRPRGLVAAVGILSFAIVSVLKFVSGPDVVFSAGLSHPYCIRVMVPVRAGGAPRERPRGAGDSRLRRCRAMGLAGRGVFVEEMTIYPCAWTDVVVHSSTFIAWIIFGLSHSPPSAAARPRIASLGFGGVDCYSPGLARLTVAEKLASGPADGGLSIRIPVALSGQVGLSGPALPFVSCGGSSYRSHQSRHLHQAEHRKGSSGG